MHVLIVCGSLREGSYNRMLAKAAEELAPAEISFEWGDISGIPLYNQDDDPAYNKALSEGDHPPKVQRLKEQIAEADAVLFVSPEYNYSIPGGLKNAIDWASRAPSPLRGKPVGVIGASTGIGGTLRMQQHIRASFQFLNAPCMLQPEVIVSQAQNRFDAAGKLVDEATRMVLKAYLEAFAKWIDAHKTS
ncbi:MAG TPA: NADPH-dependent FMN reductase [Fimbriimonadaceae bacterium]|nr:NADPH-dependent FMN reductase [Fimbriimonadaceae bacterium]